VSLAVPKIDVEKCIGSGKCVEQCPTNAVELVDGKAVIVRPSDCNYCTDCEAICPSGAIRCSFEIVWQTTNPFLKDSPDVRRKDNDRGNTTFE
jgi:ferredoxin